MGGKQDDEPLNSLYIAVYTKPFFPNNSYQHQLFLFSSNECENCYYIITASSILKIITISYKLKSNREEARLLSNYLLCDGESCVLSSNTIHNSNFRLLHSPLATERVKGNIISVYTISWIRVLDTATNNTEKKSQLFPQI